jgi:hypothetical protein
LQSAVLAKVVDQIRAKTPNGGFIKQNDNGRWYEVGDFLAREKTSQAFRDALHERYKSSNVAKKKRRQEEQTKATDRFRRGMAQSLSGERARFEWMSLSHDLKALSEELKAPPVHPSQRKFKHGLMCHSSIALY